VAGRWQVVAGGGKWWQVTGDRWVAGGGKWWQVTGDRWVAGG